MNQIIHKTVNLSSFYISKNVDFILYMLAHLETNNVASNYDQGFIDQIAKIKNQDTSELRITLKPIANGSYAYISFLPVIIPNLDNIYQILNYIYTKDEELLELISNDHRYMINYLLNCFEEKDRLTLQDFIHCCQHEYSSFYQSYWLSKQNDYNHGLDLFITLWQSPENEIILKFFDTHQKTKYIIYLSESMRVYGRGISLGSETLSAISKMPETENDLFYTYFIVIHEMLHQIVNQVTIETLNLDITQSHLNQNEEGFDIHMTLEMAVFYMHYLLSEKQSEQFVKQYFVQLSNLTGNNISSKKDLLHFYPLNDSLIQKLDNL